MEEKNKNKTRFSQRIEHPLQILEQGKLPPQSIDIENALLGALLLDSDALLTTIDFLRPEFFYKNENRIVFQAILDLSSNNQFQGVKTAIDPITVTEKLKQQGFLAEIGGPFYIAQLTNRVASSANIEYYAHIVAQNYIKRELISIGNNIVKDSYSEQSDVLDVLDSAQTKILEIGEKSFHKEVSDMKTLVSKTLKELDEIKKSDDGKQHNTIYSGFTEVDKVTQGFQPGQLVVCGARPGMGKTSFILSIARNIAIEQQKPIAIFSLEMSAREISMRFVAAETDIASETFKTRKLTDIEWERLVDKTSALAEAPIFIDDSPHISMFELRAKCRRLKQKENIQMVFVDYLQLMEGDARYAQGNREQEISKISRQMKSLARELEIPVMILSQLNRNVEQRGGTSKKGGADNSKTPQLSDLRESGAIEQDADIVLFIHRPEYYKIFEDDNGNSLEGIAIINVAKHRSGKTGDARLKWIGSLTKFDNIDLYSLPNYDPNERFEPQILQSKMNAYSDTDGLDENFYSSPSGNAPF